MTRTLNPQEETFVLELCIDWDPGRAALASGFRSKAMGTRLLSYIRIQQAIEEERARRREKYRVDGDHITEEFARIAFANARDYWPAEGKTIDLSRLDKDVTAAISEIKIDEQVKDSVTYRRTHLKLHDKQVALVNLAKSLGLLTERHLHEHTFEYKLTQMTPEERAAFARELIEAGRKYLPAYQAAQAKLVEAELEAADTGADEDKVQQGP